MDEAARMCNKMIPTQVITLRSQLEVASLVAGLTPVPPGLVPVTEWRAAADPRFGPPASVPVYGIVARKP
jgi:hypothetical protein